MYKERVGGRETTKSGGKRRKKNGPPHSEAKRRGGVEIMSGENHGQPHQPVCFQ